VRASCAKRAEAEMKKNTHGNTLLDGWLMTAAVAVAAAAAF